MHEPADRGLASPPAGALFVGGSQRSGTTLLQRLLCQAPGTNPLVGEAKYLRNLVAAYRQALRAFDVETRFYFRSRGELRQYHAGIVEQLLAHVRGMYPGAHHLVLKEPHLTLYFPELAELLPQARFLVIVRDPRDAVASMVRVGERLRASGADDIFTRMFSLRDMGALGRHYLSFYEPVLRAAGDAVLAGRLLIVRYEDLVNDPGHTLAEAGRFAGVDVSALDLTQGDDSEALEARRDAPYKRAWLTGLDARAVTDERIGASRKVLSEAEMRTLVATCRSFMERFGYRIDPP